MAALYDRILKDENIYAAAYALPGFLKEKGLIATVNKEDLKLYKQLKYQKYCIDRGFIDDCKQEISRLLNTDKDDLFRVRLFFKFKKIKGGEPEYRPIHTADIKTLVCIQAIANSIFFDDDFKKNTRHFSSLNSLIPDNFWGNVLTDKPEYLYEKWSNNYKGYVHASMDKHDKYLKSKVYKYEAYLDLVNCFPNINTYVLYQDIMHRLKDKYDKEELDRILQLLLCFILDDGDEKRGIDKYSDTELETYYGVKVGESSFHYTMGIPQGLPHCFFLANLYLLHIKKIVEEEIPCDIDYYVDDMTLFCNFNHAALVDKVKTINNKLKNTLSQKKKSPIERIDKFYTDNNITFILAFHEEDEKCSSIKIDSKKGSMRNLIVLSRNTSGVNDAIKIRLSEDYEKSSKSQADALLEAIDKELDMIKSEKSDKMALYRKRLESYYKFYKIREELIAQNLEGNVSYDTKLESFDPQALMNYGILQSTYHIMHCSRPSLSNKIYRKVRRFDKKMAGRDGIRESHLYFTADCSGYPLYLSILEPTTLYASLHNEVKKNLSEWNNGNYKLGNLLHDLEKSISITDSRLFVYQISSQFQRDYILAHLCEYLDIPINVSNCYSTFSLRQLSWAELRIIHYLHQPNFNRTKFFVFVNDVIAEANKGLYDNYSDPLILKSLPLFLNTVYSHKQNDLLILSHIYVQSIWKNGSKFLHFFTLHNEEHSVELIRLSYVISQTFSAYQLTSTDYYYLFMSCYFHDISLIIYPDVTLFKIDKGATLKSKDLRNRMIEAYQKVDSYFENEIRSKHSEESASLLRNEHEFDFLDNSTRDLVAAISKAHGENAEDVYDSPEKNKKSVEAVMTRTHVTHLKSILRLADSLDITQERVSPFYLSKTFPLMPVVSRFHWISHLAVNHCSLVAIYKSLKKKGIKIKNSYLSHENLKENISLSIFFNTGTDIIARKVCKRPCKRISVEKVERGYHINIGKNDCECIAHETCPLLCKWMHCKNTWINEELLQIADMSNMDDKRIFSTQVSVDYVLDKEKTIVDKYIPFIEDYLDEAEKFTIKDFDEALSRYDKAFDTISTTEESIKKVTTGKATPEYVQIAMENISKIKGISKGLADAFTDTLETTVNLIGRKKFNLLWIAYSSIYKTESQNFKDYLRWYRKFLDFIKDHCGLYKDENRS